MSEFVLPGHTSIAKVDQRMPINYSLQKSEVREWSYQSAIWTISGCLGQQRLHISVRGICSELLHLLVWSILYDHPSTVQTGWWKNSILIFPRASVRAKSKCHPSVWDARDVQVENCCNWGLQSQALTSSHDFIYLKKEGGVPYYRFHSCSTAVILWINPESLLCNHRESSSGKKVIVYIVILFNLCILS